MDRPDDKASFDATGFVRLDGIIPIDMIDAARSDIVAVGRVLSGRDFSGLDAMYASFKADEPENAGLIYDACKRIVSIAAIAQAPSLLSALDTIGCRFPAAIDVNFRIDSKSRERFLFDWHQDYWFSMGSKNGIVAWIPLTDVSEDLGGLELISAEETHRAIYGVRPGDTFNSYADAIKLDEDIPDEAAFPVRLSAGDVLLFRFDTLHRSLPVRSDARSRWTIQARFADFHDREFRQRGFRPASVSKGEVPYLAELRNGSASADIRP